MSSFIVLIITVKFLRLKLRGHWSKSHENFIRCIQKWLLINMLKSKLWYSNAFQNASVPNKRWSSNCSRVAAHFYILLLKLLYRSSPKFHTIYVEALVQLLIHAFIKRCCILFRNARAKSKDGQFWHLQEGPKVIGYHSNISSTNAKIISFL